MRPSGAATATPVKTLCARPESRAIIRRASASSLGLVKIRPPHRHERIGAKDEGLRMATGDGGGLFPGQTLHHDTRGFVRARRFIDIGWIDRVRLKADLAQEVETPWAGAGEHQTRGQLHLKQPIT